LFSNKQHLTIIDTLRKDAIMTTPDEVTEVLVENEAPVVEEFNIQKEFIKLDNRVKSSSEALSSKIDTGFMVMAVMLVCCMLVSIGVHYF
jgi:hypothetical protein